MQQPTIPNGIWKALLSAQGRCPSIVKGRRSGDGKYDYASADDVLALAREVFGSEGIAFVFSAPRAESLPDRAMGSKSSRGVRVVMNLLLVYAEDGSNIDIETVAEAYGFDDKVVYSAISMAKKYLLMSALGTGYGSGDAPSYSYEQPAPEEPAAPRPAADNGVAKEAKAAADKLAGILADEAARQRADGYDSTPDTVLLASGRMLFGAAFRSTSPHEMIEQAGAERALPAIRKIIETMGGRK